MRTRLMTGLVVAALGLGMAGPARAWGPGGPCGPPPVQYATQTVTCYRTEYHTEWQEVPRTVYRCAPETHNQEVREDCD